MTISNQYFRGELLLTAERTKCGKEATRDIRWHDENAVVLVTHSGQLQMVDVRTGLVVRIVDFSFCRDVMLVCQFFSYYFNILLIVYFFPLSDNKFVATYLFYDIVLDNK